MEYLSVPDKQDSPGPAGGLYGVGDHHDGVTDPVDVPKEPQKLIGRPGVQSAGRLVGQDELRLGDDGSGYGCTLLLSAGNLVGIFFQQVDQTELAANGVQPGVHFGEGFPGQDQGKVDVVLQGEGVQ